MRIRPPRYDSRDPNADPRNRIITNNERSIIGILLKQKFPTLTHYRRLNGDLSSVTLEDGGELVVIRGHWEALAGIPGKFEFDTLGDLVIETQSEKQVAQDMVDIQSWHTVIPAPKGSWGNVHSSIPDGL